VTAKNKEVIKGEITYHDTGTSTVAGVDFQKLGCTALLIR
jgi:hypothetical protein